MGLFIDLAPTDAFCPVAGFIRCKRGIVRQAFTAVRAVMILPCIAFRADAVGAACCGTCRCTAICTFVAVRAAPDRFKAGFTHGAVIPAQGAHAAVGAKLCTLIAGSASGTEVSTAAADSAVRTHGISAPFTLPAVGAEIGTVDAVVAAGGAAVSTAVTHAAVRA